MPSSEIGVSKQRASPNFSRRPWGGLKDDDQPGIRSGEAAFYLAERRAALAEGFVEGEASQGVDALGVAAVVLVGVAAEWLDRLGERGRHLTGFARRVDRIAVVFADEHHGQPKQ